MLQVVPSLFKSGDVTWLYNSLYYFQRNQNVYQTSLHAVMDNALPLLTDVTGAMTALTGQMNLVVVWYNIVLVCKTKIYLPVDAPVLR